MSGLLGRLNCHEVASAAFDGHSLRVGRMTANLSSFSALTLLVGSFDPYKPVPNMTYNVFDGTLNLTQSNPYRGGRLSMGEVDSRHAVTMLMTDNCVKHRT